MKKLLLLTSLLCFSGLLIAGEDKCPCNKPPKTTASQETDKGCGCNKPTKEADKGCGCNKPTKDSDKGCGCVKPK